MFVFSPPRARPFLGSLRFLATPNDGQHGRIRLGYVPSEDYYQGQGQGEAVDRRGRSGTGGSERQTQTRAPNANPRLATPPPGTKHPKQAKKKRIVKLDELLRQAQVRSGGWAAGCADPIAAAAARPPPTKAARSCCRAANRRRCRDAVRRMHNMPTHTPLAATKPPHLFFSQRHAYVCDVMQHELVRFCCLPAASASRRAASAPLPNCTHLHAFLRCTFPIRLCLCCPHLPAPATSHKRIINTQHTTRNNQLEQP